jgi:hypothetical protein
MWVSRVKTLVVRLSSRLETAPETEKAVDQRSRNVCDIEQTDVHRLDYLGRARVMSRAGVPMNNEYDVFEVLPNGSAVWHACVQGTQDALEMVRLLGKRTRNECFATDLSKQKIIARVNEGNRIAQVSADEQRAAGN